MGEENIHLLCHRCGCDLKPGDGNFYVVRIEAFADPTPPRFHDDELAKMTLDDIDTEINQLIESMRDMSERELLDQVYRRLTNVIAGRLSATRLQLLDMYASSRK